MRAASFKDSETSSNALNEVLSDDAYKRGVELAFFDRMIRRTARTSAATLMSAKTPAGGPDKQVAQRLRDFKNPLFTRMAREMEKSYPAEANFGKFGKYRED